jgi:hypothetical protein
VVPEEVLSEFCAGRGETFLAATRLMNKFEHISLAEGAQATVMVVYTLL